MLFLGFISGKTHIPQTDLSLVGMEHGSRGLEHVPCSAHVPHIVFRTCSERPGLLFSFRKKNVMGCPSRQNNSNIMKKCQFKKLFTLLVSEKSNSQNRHIYNFHASKNPDTNVRGISSLESGERVPHMFRTFPIGTEFHAN